jgi:hypothetical protein
MIKKQDCVYLVDCMYVSISRVVIQPSHHVMFTKNKDFISNPSCRLKFRKTLTFIETEFPTIRDYKVYDLIRLRCGDIIIKFDFGVLRYYLNLTKNRVEFVIRIDHPSEIQCYLDPKKGVLYSTPNINYLKKFYLLSFSLEL